MGSIILLRNLSEFNQDGLLKPIIYCYPYTEIAQCAVSTNDMLARELIKYESNRRTMQIERIFEKVVGTLPDECVIKDFDVLFNPAYKIDVIRVMINARRVKPFRVLWPGSMVDNVLIYAEPGYKDFQTFNIENYDVTCVGHNVGHNI